DFVREVAQCFWKSGSILMEIDNGTSLSYAAPMCFGLAPARPDLKVIAIDGDGSVVAGLAFLTTLGRYSLSNFVLVVIDNGFYLSTDRGRLQTATRYGADLTGIAKAAGIECAANVSTPEETDDWVRRALNEEGPFVIVAKVDREARLDHSQRSPVAPGGSADRTEASMLFRLWLANHPASAGARVPRSATRPDIPKEDLAESLPGRGPAQLIYQALKAAGINMFVYLPDSVTYPIQQLAELDPEMLTICCAREDEGVAIASGAYYGGLLPALVIEGSGVGYSALALAGSIMRRTPLLIVSSHSEVLGVRFDHDSTSRLVNESVLRALGIPYTVLARVEDAPAVIREAIHEMRILKMPAGVVLPPYVMSNRGLG
ncbi:MAG TPA: thiamine pyrophosphate-dependent enzyme, partial [Chloroflexota bacterium]|nr:thiamine pyrophosphate-dependent enzyme [Chloroflexota bacterium]